MQQSRPKLRCITRILSTTSSILAAFALSQAANSMEFHRNGDKIYVSGPVELMDHVRLARMLDAAENEGIKINTIVFRTSPGGVAFAGHGIGEMIRQRGLNTAVQGGCYSACAAAFVGGDRRHDTVDDLPLLHPAYERTIFASHGSSLYTPDKFEYDVSVGAPLEDQRDSVGHYDELLRGQISQEAMKRIKASLTELKDTQGFLRYFVNDDKKETTFCPSGNQSAADCVSYPGVTIRSDSIVNAGQLDLSSDYLWVRETVSGNINPNFRPFYLDPVLTNAFKMPAPSEHLLQPPTAEAFGVIRVANGGVWHMTEATGADIIAAEKGGRIILEAGTAAASRLNLDHSHVPILYFGTRHIIRHTFLFTDRPRVTAITATDGGTIEMRGGRLAAELTASIRSGGTLMGNGIIGSNLSISKGAHFVPDGIVVQPFELVFFSKGEKPSRVSLNRKDPVLSLAPGSETLFNISVGDMAKIRLVEAETIIAELDKHFPLFFSEVHRGRLAISPGANATIRVSRDFYTEGTRSTFVDVQKIEGSPHHSPDFPSSLGVDD